MPTREHTRFRTYVRAGDRPRAVTVRLRGCRRDVDDTGVHRDRSAHHEADRSAAAATRRAPRRAGPPHRGGAARCRGRRARVLPGQRAHRDVGRPGERARAGRGRRGRLRGRAVHAEPGEGGGRRLRRRRQGAGAAHGAGSPRPRRHRPSRPTPPTPPRSRCATSHGRRAARLASRAAADDRLAARHAARTVAVGRGARRGRRRRLPRHGHTPHARLVGEPGTEVFLYVHHHIREDAQTLYGFPTPRRARRVRGAARRPRRRAGARAGDPRGARPGRAASTVVGRRRPRRAVPRARASARRRRRACCRAEGAGSTCPSSTSPRSTARPARRGTSAIGRRARGARRARLRHRRGPRGAARAARRRRRSAALLRDALQRWPRGAAVRDELLEPGAGRRREELASRSSLRPRRSTSSSASAS